MHRRSRPAVKNVKSNRINPTRTRATMMNLRCDSHTQPKRFSLFSSSSRRMPALQQRRRQVRVCFLLPFVLLLRSCHGQIIPTAATDSTSTSFPTTSTVTSGAATTTVPSTPTTPTTTPATTTNNTPINCQSTINDIALREALIGDVTMRRTYILCPNTIYEIGSFLTMDKILSNGQAMIPLRPNLTIQCGIDGSRNNQCIIHGGDIQVDGTDHYGITSSSSSFLDHIVLQGITFTNAHQYMVWINKPGSIHFIDCAFQNNTQVSYTPILLDYYNPSTSSNHTTTTTTATTKNNNNPMELVVTFSSCTLDNNHFYQMPSQPALIVGNGNQNRLIVQDSYFTNNDMMTNNTLSTTNSFLIETSGPLTMLRNCFHMNQLGVSPVAVYGNELIAVNNYHQDNNSMGIKCPMASLFLTSKQYEEFVPQCIDYDTTITTCMAQKSNHGGPTISPTVQPTVGPTGLPTLEVTIPLTIPPTTSLPSYIPSSYSPTVKPTPKPSYRPSPLPTTTKPTFQPTLEPTFSPSSKPTRAPIQPPMAVFVLATNGPSTRRGNSNNGGSTIASSKSQLSSNAIRVYPRFYPMDMYNAMATNWFFSWTSTGARIGGVVVDGASTSSMSVLLAFLAVVSLLI